LGSKDFDTKTFDLAFLNLRKDYNDRLRALDL
jgi:hypothetical protein